MKISLDKLHPYDANVKKQLLDELPDGIDNHSIVIVHNFDESELFPLDSVDSVFNVSILDVLVDPKDVNMLKYSRLHGKETYERILPHVHEINMYLAVAIPVGVAFAVYSEKLNNDEKTACFLVFDKDHKRIGKYDALQYKNFLKLEKLLRPMMCITEETLKEQYLKENHPEVFDKIHKHSKGYSDFALALYFEREARLYASQYYMHFYKAYNVFGITPCFEQKIYNLSFIVMDKEYNACTELNKEYDTIPVIGANVERMKEECDEKLLDYTSMVINRYNSEKETITDPDKTVKDFIKLIESEYTEFNIKMKQLDEVNEDVKHFFRDYFKNQ